MHLEDTSDRARNSVMKLTFPTALSLRCNRGQNCHGEINFNYSVSGVEILSGPSKSSKFRLYRLECSRGRFPVRRPLNQANQKLIAKQQPIGTISPHSHNHPVVLSCPDGSIQSAIEVCTNAFHSFASDFG